MCAKKAATDEAAEDTEKTSVKPIDQIKAFVENLSSLQVLTLTGTINFSEITLNEEEGTLQWSELLGSIGKGIKLKQADLRIAAYTHASFDQDAVIFVSENTADQALVTAHHAAVDAAHKTRYEAVTVIAKTLGSLFT